MQKEAAASCAHYSKSPLGTKVVSSLAGNLFGVETRLPTIYLAFYGEILGIPLQISGRCWSVVYSIRDFYKLKIRC